MDRYYTKIYINQMESNDVVDSIHEIAGYDYEVHNQCREITDNNHDFKYSFTTDVRPLEIYELRKMLDQAETLGATHVSINYHGDHVTYNVDGFLFRASTQEEINMVLSADADYLETSEKVSKQQKEIDDIKEEYYERHNKDRYTSH